MFRARVSVRFAASSITRLNTSSNTALVFHTLGSPVVSIDLFVAIPGKPELRKTMSRPTDEPAIKTIERIRMLFTQSETAAPAVKGKRVTREDILKECLPITAVGRLAFPSLDLNQPNGDFWANVAELVVGSTLVHVKYNVATILSIEPPGELQVGVPVVVKVVLSAASDGVEYVWAIAAPKEDVIVGRGSAYIPAEHDVGRVVLVKCRIAGAMDGLWTECTVGTVLPPRLPMPRWRHLTNASSDPPSLRVVTYNVLNQESCSTPRAKSTVYPFASDKAMSQDHRQGRVAEELLTYRGDIVCMQEVGKDAFDKYYFPVLQQHGDYEGVLSVKGGQERGREGCATLFNAKRFELMSPPVTIPLTMATLMTQHPEMAAEIMLNHRHLAEALSKVLSVALVMILKDKVTKDIIISSNTHLYFHLIGCHIRALQAFMIQSCQEQCLNLQQLTPSSHVLLSSHRETSIARQGQVRTR